MIALTKLASPRILTQNAAAWRAELLATIAAGEEPTKAQKNRYNHVDIKAQLVEETHGKCSYCESKMRHVDDGDIEHILPKAKHPDLSFDWENLTLACTICNRKKGDHDAPPGDAQSLVNPYQDDPKAHFLFHREILTPTPESVRGSNTENILELNRADLRERRREKIDELHQYVTAYAQAEDDYKPLVSRQIRKQCVGADKEYSAFLEQYISEMITRGTLPEDVLS
ncbi:HNH endonuclease [Nioella nitratireducens]|uniref:HNH endonuclease n=1 Tax=Nioella nitratireducens TaxID=1287720 RepID=UPI0008FD14BD|nr:HNH endonuclease [Nioella nitratireducens]